jgi:hypothetical protein
MVHRNIGGCTVHSWAGIATGEAPVERLVEINFNQSWVVERWRDTHAVIIDESRFEMARRLGRALLKSS